MDYSFARAILYFTAPQVLSDHLLFGSGLASYATYSSGQVGYSLIYGIYNIDIIWGLLEGDCPFVSDTFFPELAQFGIVGIGLYFYFWIWVYKKIKIRTVTPHAIQLYKLGLLILAFVFIESIAGSMFLQASGSMVMMILGFVIRDMSTINQQAQVAERKL